MKKKTILITGGTGYIGSIASVSFIEWWYDVIIIDNLSNSSSDAIDVIEELTGVRPEFYEIDLRDKARLRQVFQTYDIDGVVHFAWLKAVWESFEKPFLYYDNNITGTLNLLECMIESEVYNLIFSSSATVYDSINPPERRESMKIGSSNPYGYTKIIIEELMTSLAQVTPLHAVSLRYFNPVWAHPSGRLWENPTGTPNNLIPYIMEVLLGKREELRIYGDDYDTRDGTGIRDYVDVNDLARWHLLAYKFLEHKTGIKEGFCTPINLWTGRWTSVREIIAAVEAVTGRTIPYRIYPRRSGDLDEYYCNPEKANKELVWSSETPLKQSLSNVWKYVHHKNPSK